MRDPRRNCFAVIAAASIVLVVSVVPESASAAPTYSANLLYPIAVPSAYSGNGHPSGADDGQVVTGEVVNDGTGHTHALLWTAPSGSVVDLNPTGFFESVVVSTDGDQQVGRGEFSANGVIHEDALLWSATAASAVDLNPSGYESSTAYALSNTQEVGVAAKINGTTDQAMLWSGTAASAINLTPAGFGNTQANGTDGVQQVGAGLPPHTGFSHALLWSGTAASVVDLNPPVTTGFQSSAALAVDGNQEVGDGVVPMTGGLLPLHALLWFGTAASAVDLNPTDLSGFTESEALDTNGTEQVGYANGKVLFDAMAWFGTPDSAVDLSNSLPTRMTWKYSEAYSVDAAGNVFGFAWDTNNEIFAVEWSPVPEPSVIGILLTSVAGLMFGRRRNLGRKS